MVSLLTLSAFPVGGGAAFVSGGEGEVRAESGSPSVVLTCPTEGNVPPVTSHTWSRNGVDITSDGTKHTIAPDGSLTISDVELGDTGTYSCTPANALGNSNSTSTTLDVESMCAHINFVCTIYSAT